MLRVALTGCIGSGKSETLRAFRRAGAAVFSADEIAHELSRPGRPVHRAVRRAFGPAALDARGRLDRPALARLVFSDPALRRRLEAVSHPPIARELLRRVASCRRPVAVADVPLLFEAGLATEFDVALVVTAPRALRLRRLKARGMPRAEALRRMRAQWPERRKERAADAALANDGSLAELRRRAAAYQKAFDLIARGRTARGSR